METFIRYSASLLPWAPIALLAYCSAAGIPPETTCIYTGLALVAAYTFTIMWTLLERWRRRKRTVLRQIVSIYLSALSPILPLLAVFFAQSTIRNISNSATSSVPVALATLTLALGLSLAISMWAWKILAAATELKGDEHVVRRR